MSAGHARPFAEVAPIAVELMRLLEPSCTRVAVAGSLRRRRSQVRDIELVAIPRVETETIDGFFADFRERREHNRLAERLAQLRTSGTLPLRDVEVRRQSGRVEIQQRDGERYKALVYRGIPIDLFLATESNWGCVFALRTGPYDWNVELVTQIQRYFRRVEGTRVFHLAEEIPTPTEEAFFRACGQRWVDPPDRRVDRVLVEPWRFAAAEVPA